MADTQELKSQLSEALKKGNAELAEQTTQQLIEAGVDPLELIQSVIVPTLTEVGDDFQEFRIFLPELMKSGEAAKRASELLEQTLIAQGGQSASLGTVVIGTVENDVHDIGKNIVATLLKAHGFTIVDLGRDVSPTAFLEAAEKENADIIAMSSLMTTTRQAQRSTIDIFNQTGKRDSYKIIVGGGCVNQQWADQIGADGYAADAAGTVNLCKSLVGA